MQFPLLYCAIFALGLIGLVWSSHYFVGGSASLAKHLGMTPGLIGLTIVAFGTSAPEMVVSASAAIEGEAPLGVGNAVGSNIANIGLVLGVTALFVKLPISKSLLLLEMPVLFVVTAAAVFFLSDLYLTRVEGSILLLAGISLPWLLIWHARRAKRPNDCASEIDAITEQTQEEIPDLTRNMSIAWLLGGLVVLLASAEATVRGATGIAYYYEIDPVIIGLTIVALGTSLPELAASIASAIKGHHEMAVGNIIGSNVFNLLLVMSLPGIISTATLESSFLSRDTLAMIILTLALVLIVIAKLRLGSRSLSFVGKPTGLLLLTGYIAYMAVISNSVIMNS